VTPLTPDEIRAIALGYLRDQQLVQQECEATVVNWRPGDARMVSPQPLFDQVDTFFEYMRGWDVARPGRWLGGEHDIPYPWNHGFDAQGRVRVLTYGLSKWFFLYRNGSIDEVVYESDGSGLILSRYVSTKESGVVSAWYQMRESKEVSCKEEQFIWEDRRIVKSVVRTWIWENDNPVESEFSESYHYTYGGASLTRCVRTMTRAGRPWSKRAVFERRLVRRVIDWMVEFLRHWTVERMRRRSWRSSP